MLPPFVSEIFSYLSNCCDVLLHIENQQKKTRNGRMESVDVDVPFSTLCVGVNAETVH